MSMMSKPAIGTKVKTNTGIEGEVLAHMKYNYGEETVFLVLADGGIYEAHMEEFE